VHRTMGYIAAACAVIKENVALQHMLTEPLSSWARSVNHALHISEVGYDWMNNARQPVAKVLRAHASVAAHRPLAESGSATAAMP
jgi:hypothetical protein